MKLALLFFGISKEYKHEYWRSGRKYSIDYNLSYNNYKQFIYGFFEKEGYDIDVYFTTNNLDDKDRKTLCEKYNPVKYSFMENHKNHTISRNNKLDKVIDLCLDSGIAYDLVLKDHLICDNFYLFPYKYLRGFSKVVKKNMGKSHHFIKKDIESIMPDNSINYILNQRCPIRLLSFYKIVRRPTL